MLQLAFTVILVFAVLAGWLAVQRAARRLAARHPEYGPVREPSGGCGGCLGSSCRNEPRVDCDREKRQP